MPLTSDLFKGDQKLEDCQVKPSAHIVPGARGPHVGKIQKALIILGAGTISAAEIAAAYYGPTTTSAVVQFKTKRQIINKAYENTVDNIVGIMTITALDKEMRDFELRPAPPVEYSFYVSLTMDGDIHNHAACRTKPYATTPGPDGRAQHRGAPINPQRWGRMINIGGEGEAVGFEDFLVRNSYGQYYGPPRPFTETIPRGTASDICMRSAPLENYIIEEIMAIAANNCRFTFAGKYTDYLIAKWMGIVVEDLKIRFGPGDDDFLWTSVQSIVKPAP